LATPSLPRRRLVEPISTVEHGFFGSAGFYVRIGAIGAAALMVFAVLFLRLWSLQVIQGSRFARATQAQAFRVVHLPRPRGTILDRSGRVFAGDEGELAVTAHPAALGTTGAHGRWRPTVAGRTELRRLARLARLPTSELTARIRMAVRRAPFAPAVVISKAPRDLAFYLEEHASRFRPFSLVGVPQRSYPNGPLGSEFLGLLGEVNPKELHQRRYRGTQAGQIVGQSGVEATYDRILDEGLATAHVPVDASGNIVGPLRSLPFHHTPHSLELTIDTSLQRVAGRAIRDGIALAHRAGHADANAGAAIVMNPWDGSIYALASYPNFDQAAAARDQSYRTHLFARTDPGTPLLNRATQGLYPTGSAFKPIVAEAALADGLITPSSIIPCTGSLTVGNVVFHNVEAGINANLNLDQALAISCDTWFYRLGTMLYARQVSTGALDMQRWAMRLGLGHPTGVDIPGEYGGVVPTPGWLRRTFHDPAQKIWYEGYSVNLAIGQGYLAVTPLQLAVAYSALANGGTVVRPHVARAVVRPSGRILRRLRFAPRAHLRLVDAGAIRRGLYDGAHSGTSAAIFGSFPIPVAGKTGTAQTPTGSDHSWYASWAPASHPRVVVVVLIEHGGFGAEAAASAAREIYSAFFHLRG